MMFKTAHGRASGESGDMSDEMFFDFVEHLLCDACN